MNDVTSEYLNGNGNGSNGHANGNGNGKIFDLKRIDDPMLAINVPQARRRVCQNNRISTGARMLFCFITDASLTPGLCSKKGVVKFSDADLAHRFEVNPKTIRNWKMELRSTGELWLTEKHMKNTFPQTVYNVSCIVGQQPELPNIESQDGSLPEHEIWTSNRRRQRLVLHDPVTGRFASRNTPPGVQPIVPVDENLQNSLENAPSEKILPPTTAIDCRPQRQKFAAHHGKNLPLPTAKICRPARKSIAAVDGKNLPLSTANDCRSARQNFADNIETGDVSLRDQEQSSKRSTGLNALKKDGGAKKITAENAFLADVAWIMDLWKPAHGKFELENSGAWWRQCHRSDADLIARVLAETKTMIHEGKIKTTPGQVAVDLWKRWNLDRLRSVTKQKTAATAAART